MTYPACIYLGEPTLGGRKRACLCPAQPHSDGVLPGTCARCPYDTTKPHPKPATPRKPIPTVPAKRPANSTAIARNSTAPKVELPCVHLGKDTGETVTCKSCTTVDAPVIECVRHDKCLPVNSAPGYHSCGVCKDRQPSTGDKPRVFLAGYPSDIGGANTEAWHLVRLWRKLGIEVHLIPTWRLRGGYHGKLQALGCTTHRATPETLADVPGLRGATVVSLCNRGFMDHLDKFKALGCRTIWLNCMTQLFDWEVQTYERHGLPDLFIFQSEYQRKCLESQLARFGYKPEIARLIRGSFIADEFPWNFKPRGNEFFVGKLARPDAEKWPADLWQTLEPIPERRAVLMGVDDAIAKTLGPAPAWAEVLKPGAVPAKDFYARLHCLMAIGGAKENWPRVGLEAMAAGVPIIAPDEGGWREMIRHGETGFLARVPCEAAEFAAKLANDEGLRHRIANAARASLAELTAGVGEAWSELLAPKPAAKPYGLKELVPEISVVMPVYNGGPYLAQAVESLLGQTFRDFELVAVDDGSTDDSLAVLREFAKRDRRVKVLVKKNGGTGSALNLGFAQSRGNYQTWWSADSWVQPTFLADLKAGLDANPQAVMAYSDFRTFDQDAGSMSGTILANDKNLYRENQVGPCWLWRREAKDRAGDFSLRMAEDWDMHRRLAKVGPFVRIPKMLGTWRQHKDCLTVRVERNPKPWKLERVPQVAHFYWGNRVLSFLRWQSIVSFRKLNPDWLVKVHVPQTLYSGPLTWWSHEHKDTGQAITGSDHTADLLESGVEIVPHDFGRYGFREDVPENFKSDFLRWVLLADEGGLWCDFDIVFTAPMTKLQTNTAWNYNSRAGLCQYEDGTHAIGLLYSSAGNDFFAAIRDKARAGLDLNNYQSIGNYLLESWRDVRRIEKEFGIAVDKIPKHAVYLFDWQNTRKMFLESHRFDRPGVIGIHWYGGDKLAQEWEEKVTAGNWRDFDNTIRRALEVTA